MPPLAGASGADFDCDLDFLPILRNFSSQKKSISLGFVQQVASNSGWGRLRISPNFFFFGLIGLGAGAVAHHMILNSILERYQQRYGYFKPA
jgi:hypothetical protein